eukprot:GILK01014014.1.p1 GENE.GILK01014014.1~~GILK01014014.1.p1  ORF type:complete len:245 (-),score=39.34 GILK01014014.1:214-903(-)
MEQASFAPPEAYGLVEPGIHRSNILHSINFPFISSLNLKTVLYLSSEGLPRAVQQFLEERHTKLIHLGLKAWKPDLSWKPISEELIKEGLEIVLNVTNHPVMILCTSGIHLTGTLVGCLRRLQNWNMTAIVDEYRCYAGNKSRFTHEQFVEFFDVDLVTLPAALPAWFLDQAQVAEEEEELLSIWEKENWVQDSNKPAFLRYYFAISGPLVSPGVKFSQNSLCDDDDMD